MMLLLFNVINAMEIVQDAEKVWVIDPDYPNMQNTASGKIFYLDDNGRPICFSPTVGSVSYDKIVTDCRSLFKEAKVEFTNFYNGKILHYTLTLQSKDNKMLLVDVNGKTVYSKENRSDRNKLANQPASPVNSDKNLPKLIVTDTHIVLPSAADAKIKIQYLVDQDVKTTWRLQRETISYLDMLYLDPDLLENRCNNIKVNLSEGNADPLLFTIEEIDDNRILKNDTGLQLAAIVSSDNTDNQMPELNAKYCKLSNGLISLSLPISKPSGVTINKIHYLNTAYATFSGKIYDLFHKFPHLFYSNGDKIDIYFELLSIPSVIYSIKVERDGNSVILRDMHNEIICKRQSNVKEHVENNHIVLDKDDITIDDNNANSIEIEYFNEQDGKIRVWTITALNKKCASYAEISANLSDSCSIKVKFINTQKEVIGGYTFKLEATGNAMAGYRIDLKNQDGKTMYTGRIESIF